CGSSCVDTSVDDKNCGARGTECDLEFSCSRGVCVHYIVSSQDVTTGLSLSGSSPPNLYWGTAYGPAFCPTTGSCPFPSVVDVVGFVRSVSAAAWPVVYCTGTDIYAADTTFTVRKFTPVGGVFICASDGHDIYWANGNGELWSVSVSSGSPPTFGSPTFLT